MIYLLPHTISNSALLFPNRDAFRFGNHSITYQGLEAKMNQLSNLIHQIGIKKGDRIGIYLNRSLETAAAIYGIMNAGAIYVPLDPNSPPERTKFLIDDCGINILITNQSQKRKINKIVDLKVQLTAVIGLDDLKGTASYSWDYLYEMPSDFKPVFNVLGDDVAYIIYTSGSTGSPKGIMHTHSSGLAYARLTADLYKLTEEDIFGNHAPIFFDISTLGYFTAPFVGACTIIASDAHISLPASLAQLIEKEKITIWYSVPLALIQMMQFGVIASIDVSPLRWVLYAGEAFPAKYLRQLMETWTHAKYSNIYGPTELNQCTYYNISSLPREDQEIPLGEVWGNTERLVIDESGNELSIGEGELCVRSATMMKGYWQQPDLTRKSFFLRRNNLNQNDVFYRTGDLVRIDGKDTLHFIGRKDHQVKIRGYRVELGSIESALVSHNAIAEAVVMTKKVKLEPLKLIAIIVLDKAMDICEARLKLYLKEKLPAYAIPEKITFLNSLPRTASGKVKRSKLKELLYSKNARNYY